MWDRLYFFPPGAFAKMCITQKVCCPLIPHPKRLPLTSHP